MSRWHNTRTLSDRTVECASCGIQFVMDSRRRSAKYCSKSCLAKGNSAIATKATRIARRFWKHVDKLGPLILTDLGPCWQWIGGHTSNGYGKFSLFGKSSTAHRASWFLHTGQVPELFVCHRCDNKSCVNPSHLFIGDHVINMRDMAVKGRDKHRAGGRLLEQDGQSLPLSEWANIAVATGIGRQRFLARVNAGWTIARAMNPARAYQRRSR